jgi:hypothetical protein
MSSYSTHQAYSQRSMRSIGTIYSAFQGNIYTVLASHRKDVKLHKLFSLIRKTTFGNSRFKALA